MSNNQQQLKRVLTLAFALAGFTWVGFRAGKHSLIGRMRIAVQQALWNPSKSSSSRAAVSIPELTQPRLEPVRVIFDTDLGNDVDDVLALALLHELANRGEADLLAVTLS